MMAQERYDRILQMLEADGRVSIEALKTELGFSIETLRRDLKQLEGKNLLKRVYGGAVLAAPSTREPSYSTRTTRHLDAKMAIARKAASLIHDGDSIALDLGTTVLETAKLLVDKQNLTVLTNSLDIAQFLLTNTSHKIYLLGGLLRSGENATSGMSCEMMLDSFRVDKAIVGVAGIGLAEGVTDYVEGEVQVRKKMISIAKQIIGLADYSKFDQVAFCKVCDASRFDTLITDGKTPAETVRQFVSAGINIMVADSVQ